MFAYLYGIHSLRSCWIHQVYHLSLSIIASRFIFEDLLLLSIHLHPFIIIYFNSPSLFMSLYGQTLLSVSLTPFHLLSRMTCNLILIFLSGIIATTFNNFTHFLHQPGDMLYCSLSFFYFRPDIGFHFIPEVTGIQTEFSNIILVSFIALCILLSLFCQSDVRNKMWCDFGRIASIMIVTKVLLYCSSYAVGISWMDDTFTRSSPSLQTLCNELSANRLDGNFHSSGTYSVPFFFMIIESIIWKII